MKPKDRIKNEGEQPLEVAVGVFANAEQLSRVAASIRGPEIKFQRVSLLDPASADDLPNIAYENIDHVEVNHVGKGVLQGGVVGFSSGLLASLPAMGTGLFVAAPLVGLLTGAWIGGVAGADEANRGEELPNHEDYESMLKDGKALLVLTGAPEEREGLAHKMISLGAEKVHQHPPLHQFVR